MRQSLAQEEPVHEYVDEVGPNAMLGAALWASASAEAKRQATER
jgi:hypothetical protein